ncbi:PAS domain S-box protein [Anabaena sp. CA = ATCC 33047]|uniref:PAS domain S-box protein n=1 Tax=Anabaena sp. (strain CA / ATCC 33047) TaxID=52271 RepID=UPI000AA3251F|nr:PAS domain S-box protein [Anabaena sp. CA = ATCC 33047]
MPSLPQLLWLQCWMSIIDCSPLTVEPETPVSKVISLMAKQGAGMVVVIDSLVVGYLLEQDVVKLVAAGINCQNTPISAVMQHAEAITYKLSNLQNITTIFSLLAKHQSSCLLVVDELGELVGTVTSASICQGLQKSLNHPYQAQETQLPENRQLVWGMDKVAPAMLQLIIDTIPQCVFWKDRNSVFLGCNRQFARMLGFEHPEEIIGKTDYDFLTNHEDADFYRQCDASVMEKNTPIYHIIEPLQQADGQQIWLETNKVPLHDAEGNVIGVLGTFEDITERKQTQEALANSEERFRFLAASIPQQVWIARPDGYLEYANHRTLEYFGCNLEQTLGWQWEKFVHPDDLPRCLASWSQCLATGANYEVEFRLLGLGSGTYRWHLARALPLRNPQGNIINWFGTNTDIHDYKCTQEALAERIRLADFRAEVDSILTHSWSLQEMMRHCTETVVKHLNAAFARIWLVNKQENVLELQVSSGMYTHIDGAHRRIAVGEFKIGLIAQEGKPHLTNSVQNDARVSNQEWAKQEGMVAFAGYPMIVEGEVLGVIAMFARQALGESTFQALGIAAHEIAIGIQRKQTQIALQESEERFRNLVEATSDWVWEVDENIIFTYVSPKVKDILGYEPQELIGTSPLELLPPEEVERVAQVFEPIATAQQPFKCLENINIHKNGHLVILETSGVPIFNAEGKFCGYRGIDRDITTRKQAEIALRETQQRLQAILDNSPAVIYVSDVVDNRYLLFNRQGEKLLNVTQEQIIGKSIYDVWPRHIADEFAKNNADVLTTGQALEIEEIVTQEDGLHTYLSVKFPLKDTNGVIFAVCGISTDITERKLAEESLLRFHKAMNSTSDCILIGDLMGEAVYVNPAFQQLYGYNVQELAAAGGAWVIFQQSLERRHILNALHSGKSWRGEVTMRSRNGQIMQVYLRADAIKDAHDQVIGTVCIYTDITQRKQVEEGLRLRDRAIAASNNGIIIADASIANGPIIYVNPAFESMTGYSADEVIGQNFRLFQSANINQPGLEELNAAMQEGRGCSVVLQSYRPDGSMFWHELNISPVYDVAGRLTHYIGIQTDITERKQAETALLISQQRLQYLLTSSPAVIYACETGGDFGAVFISENAKDVLGYEATEFTSNSGLWASLIHPEDAPKTFAKLAQSLEIGEYKLEYRFLHQDGTYRWLYDQGKVVRDNLGNPIEFVGYTADITERKQLEEEIKVALEKEKELSELKSRFVAMTSHEFRTPLSTILSSSELLEHYRHRWTEEKQQTHLHRIQAAVKRMTEMLNDVLVIGKAEAGKLEFTPRQLDLVDYCRHVVEEIPGNLIHERVNFVSDRQSFICYMDDKLLSHILSNLLSNAIKYSSANSQIKFYLNCSHEQVIFKIQDSGIGIPPEDLPHLFETFHRAKNVGNIVGTGLGLAIVKKCVDIYQGEIFVKSTLGVGTVFTVHLPLK